MDNDRNERFDGEEKKVEEKTNQKCSRVEESKSGQ